MRAYFEAMRLGRWPRSLALLVGCAACFLLHPGFFQGENIATVAARAGLAFLLTWAISTANYIINEIADAPYDAHHPTKRNRPLVRGEIRRFPFLAAGAVLILVSLLAARLFFSPAFFYSLFALLIAGFIYNIKPVRTKDIPFLDSISESANNPIRFFIGWFAFAPAHVMPPLALLLCWWAFGNFLMVAKRLSEFRLLQDKAGDYRRSLKRYSRNSLLAGMAASALVFFATYLIFSAGTGRISMIVMALPVLVYFGLFFHKTLREREIMEEPERLFKQPIFAAYSLLLAVGFLLSFLLDKPGG